MTPDWTSLWRAWLGPQAPFGGAGDETLRGAQSAFQAFADCVKQSFTSAQGQAQHEALIAALEQLLGGFFSQHSTPAPNWNDWILAGAKSAPGTSTAAGTDAWTRMLASWINSMLDLPALGPQRELQLAGQRLGKATLAQGQAWQVLVQHYQHVAQLAVQGFAEFLRDDEGSPITTIAALYDAWIDQCERAYREVVMSEAFARDFANWVNAASAERIAALAVVERAGQHSLWPQRSELDAYQQRLARLTEELEQLRAQVAAVSEPVVAPETVQAPFRAHRPAAKKKSKARRASVKSDKRTSGKTKDKAKRPRMDEFDIKQILKS